MAHIGFWQLLLDDKVSYWEAQKINKTSDTAEVAQSMAATNQEQTSALQQRVDQLSREVVMLRTAVTVLTQTLKDTKVIDDRLLDARLEAAMEEAFPKPPTQPQPHAKAPPEPARTCVCVKCRQVVPASSTSMTADGPICDRCPPPPL